MHDPTEKYGGTLSPRKEKLAKFISLVEQPPFLSIPAFALICMLLSEDFGKGLICTFAAIVTAVVFPLVNIVYFSKKYNNSDRLDVENKDQRFLPLVIGVIGYAIGVVALYLLNAPHIATVLMICYAVVTFAILLITFYWKISIHSCGTVGPSIGLAIAFWPWGLLYILLLPPVAWSRYVLRKHTPLQLVMGAVVGFVISIIIFMLMM